MSIQTTNPTADVTDRSTRQLGGVSITDNYQDEYLPQLLNEAKRVCLLLEELVDRTYPSITVSNTTPLSQQQEGNVWIDSSVITSPWTPKIYDTTGVLAYPQVV